MAGTMSVAFYRLYPGILLGRGGVIPEKESFGSTSAFRATSNFVLKV
jgi:hypothetical protein